MSKVRQYIKPISSGTNRFTGESNDCTVRALANAKEIPYHEAHEILKSVGRKHGDGVRFPYIHKAYTSAGLRLICSFGTTNASQIANILFNCPNLKGISLAKLLPQLQNGKFIVGIRGHVFAVIDGDIIDYTAIQGSASAAYLFSYNESN